MINTPTISIVIPLFNRETLIKETIRSLIAQTYTNWECLVVDDGSTDDSYEVVQNIAKSESRIKVYHRNREPKGASTCRNIGALMATGDYLMFFDSDDILERHCFEYRIKQIERYPTYDAWIFPTAIFNKNISDARYLWNELNKDRDDLLRFLDMDMPWDISGPIWRNSNGSQWFDENAQSAQDWEMHINKLIDGLAYIKIDEGGLKSVHTYYRKSEDNISIGTDFYGKEKLENRWQTIERTIGNIYKKKNVDEKLQIAINRLITFYCIKLMKVGLDKQSYGLWNLYKPTFFKCRMHKLIGWWYFCAKRKQSIFAKIFEFIIYRWLKKGYLFETKDTTFSNVKVLNDKF